MPQYSEIVFLSYQVLEASDRDLEACRLAKSTDPGDDRPLKELNEIKAQLSELKGRYTRLLAECGEVRRTSSAKDRWRVALRRNRRALAARKALIRVWNVGGNAEALPEASEVLAVKAELEALGVVVHGPMYGIFPDAT